jgi:choline dehydrogenase
MRYATSRRGLLTAGTAQVGLFVRSNDHVPIPDLQIQMRPFSMLIKGGKYMSEPAPAVTASCTLVRPESKGYVKLASADPSKAPRMVANYLTDERDLAPMIAGIRLIRRVFESTPFREHFRGETLPGPSYDTDDKLVEYLRAYAQSMYHPVGTCKMGNDASAVVDHQLRVHGVERLRVVDASIMPRITSGNTNAPTIMIAEKAADMILQARREQSAEKVAYPITS